MKREIVRIEDIANYSTLYNGWLNASEGDGKDKREDVIEFGKNLEANLKSLQKRLLNGTWEADNGHTFWMYGEEKWREIHVVGVEDRIVHYALVHVFQLSKHFINRTYGSIKGRGTLKANKQVRRDLRDVGPDAYCLKLDIKHYYPNISKEKLIDLLRQRYKGEAAIQLFGKVIAAYKRELSTGISIGSLTSQDSGNFYMTPIDYLILYALRIKHYVRYVDDSVLLFATKEEAIKALKVLQEAIKEYSLEYGKISLFPVSARRIDFCAYAIGVDNIRLRRRIAMRFVRKVRQYNKRPIEPLKERNSICSYLGYMAHSNSYHLFTQIFDEYDQVFNRINRCAKSKRGKGNGASASRTEHLGVPQILQPSRGCTRRGKNSRGDRGTTNRNYHGVNSGLCECPGHLEANGRGMEELPY